MVETTEKNVNLTRGCFLSWPAGAKHMTQGRYKIAGTGKNHPEGWGRGVTGTKREIWSAPLHKDSSDTWDVRWHWAVQGLDRCAKNWPAYLTQGTGIFPNSHCSLKIREKLARDLLTSGHNSWVFKYYEYCLSNWNQLKNRWHWPWFLATLNLSGLAKTFSTCPSFSNLFHDSINSGLSGPPEGSGIQAVPGFSLVFPPYLPAAFLT